MIHSHNLKLSIAFLLFSLICLFFSWHDETARWEFSVCVVIWIGNLIIDINDYYKQIKYSKVNQNETSD